MKQKVLRSIVYTIFYFYAFSGRAAERDDSRDANSLESFIAHPPVIKRLVFSERAGSGHRRLKNGKIETFQPAFRHFEAKWQTNAFFLRELNTVDEAGSLTGNVINCTSKFDARIWHFDELGGLTAYTESDKGLVSIPSLLESLSVVMNGGLPNLRIGSVTWSNRTFVSTNMWSSSSAPITYEGSLNYSNGRPANLVFHSEGPNGFHEHRIDYAFEKNAGAVWFPSHIMHYKTENEKSVLLQEITIHTLTVQKEPLPLAEFDLEPYAAAQKSPHRFMEAGVWYYTNEIGKKVVIDSLPHL
jgi:hypothetical protein